MPECIVCGSEDFDLLDGLFFCTDCGTQSQDVREEITEEAGPGDSGFVRTLKEKRSKKKIKDSSEEPKSTPLSHLERFQLVLQKQADALIQLGFNPSLKKALRLIWFQFLRHYNYAFIDNTASTGDGVSTPGTSESVATAPQAKPRRRLRKHKHLAASAGKDTPTKRAKKSDSGSYDTFPEDDHLFASDSEDEDRLTESSLEGLSGHELYMKYRSVLYKNAQLGPYFFTMKHTIPLTYLSLLCTQQNILLADLVRWVREMKVPYHNIITLLPKSVSSGQNDFLTVFAAHTVTADGIYEMARQFYLHLPLPRIPAPNAIWLCHTLMDRLRLPGSLYPVVDQAVMAIHVPKFYEDFDSPVSFRLKRWDAECLAVIVMVLRLVYGLDDNLEIQQAGAAETVPQEGLDPSNAVYVWSDWVQLYCLSYKEAHRSGIPKNESELAMLEDCQNYLESCKLTLLRTRPVPSISKNGLGRYYFNPEFHASISEIFKTSRERHQRKQQHPENDASASINTCKSPAPPSICPAPPSFTPKLVPLSFLLSHSETSRSFRDYRCLPHAQKKDHLLDIHLSHSLTFLLTICSELVGTSFNCLYKLLLVVEHSFARDGLQPLQRMMRALGQTSMSSGEIPPL